MTEAELHGWAVAAEYGLAVVTVVALVFVTAPYGRATRPGWGPTIPARLGWIVMETPPVLVWVAIYAGGDHARLSGPLVLLGLWQLHYVHRAYVYPFRMRMAGKRMPVLVAALAIVFNVLNAYVNARWVSHLDPAPLTNLADAPVTFWLGAGIMLTGLAINLHSDDVLRRLRRPGETGYRIPQGGLHRYVAAPNYFGEILEWLGWGIALGGGWVGFAFVVYTAANLAPRAKDHLRWYREKFADYPAARRALIPFVW